MDLNIFLIVFWVLLNTVVCQNPIPNGPAKERPTKCAGSNCPCCTTNDCGCNGNCTEGTFGGQCRNKCPDRCVVCYDYVVSTGDTNYNGYGYCTECRPGFYSDPPDYFQCNYICPAECVSCQSATQCHSCNKGYYLEPTTEENGQCRACPSTCAACTSSSSCSECKSQFEGNTCENCKSGYYGEYCNIPCLDSCKDNICNRPSGDCVACKDSFTGALCDKCYPGKYGQDCNQDCPVNCRLSECGRYNGQCTKGCVDNFKGITCDECINGKHSTDCSKDCPINCNLGICNRDTGLCNGCKGNFQGDMCEDCQDGRYGTECSLPCPTNCKGNVCQRTGGACKDCQDGFYGTDCSLACPTECKGNVCERGGGTCNECTDGFHGPYCNNSCSSNCYRTTCSQNGVCDKGCKTGYSGDRCCVEGVNCLECSSNNNCSKCIDGKHGETCQDDCSASCIEGKCNKEDGVCVKSSESGPDPPSSGAIAAGTLGGLALIAIIVVSLACFVKRRQGEREHVSSETHVYYNVSGTTKHTNRGSSFGVDIQITELQLENEHLKEETQRLREENKYLKRENERLCSDQIVSREMHSDSLSHYTSLDQEEKEENTYEGLTH